MFVRACVCVELFTISIIGHKWRRLPAWCCISIVPGEMQFKNRKKGTADVGAGQTRNRNHRFGRSAYHQQPLHLELHDHYCRLHYRLIKPRRLCEYGYPFFLSCCPLISTCFHALPNGESVRSMYGDSAPFPPHFLCVCVCVSGGWKNLAKVTDAHFINLRANVDAITNRSGGMKDKRQEWEECQHSWRAGTHTQKRVRWIMLLFCATAWKESSLFLSFFKRKRAKATHSSEWDVGDVKEIANVILWMYGMK